jgi:hypothetical protein
MNAHIYAFGSVCRGDVTYESDIDLLVVTQGLDKLFNPDLYSIYSYSRIAEIWKEGSPFAWHLSLEARMLYSPDSSDYLHELGTPTIYRSAARDCNKFLTLFADSATALRAGTNSPVFELSTIFLAVRNFATCYSLGVGTPDFSRHSALCIGVNSLSLSRDSFLTLERARLLCTRGIGDMISRDEVVSVVLELETIGDWMRTLILTAGKS